MDNERIQRILEIKRRLSFLEDSDINVLHAIKVDPESPLIDYCMIAAEIFVLPRLVCASLEKLLEIGFLTEVRDQNNNAYMQLNQNGLDAQQLSKLFYKE